MRLRADAVMLWSVVIVVIALATLQRPVHASWTDSGVALDGLSHELGAHILDDGAGGLLVWRATRGNNTLGHFLVVDGLSAVGNVDPKWDGNAPIARYDGWVVGDRTAVYEAWSDYNLDVFLRRLVPGSGPDPAWPANGLLLATNPGSFTDATVVADATGAFVAYRKDRTSYVVKRVLADGTYAAGWPAAGRTIGTLQFPWSEPNIRGVPDGSGGAYFFWGDDYLSVQRITATSAIAPGWDTDGMLVEDLSSLSDFRLLEVFAEESAFLIAWYGATPSGQMVGLMKIDRDGLPLPGWGVQCTPVSSFETTPQVASDGNGGAWIAWRDAAGVRGSHVTASGIKDLDAIELLEPGTAAYGNVGIAAGAAGGAIVFWSSPASGPPYLTDVLRARWLLADGSADPSQPSAGRVIDSDHSQVVNARTDGNGGAYVVWSKPFYYIDTRISWLPYPQQSVGIDGGGGTRDAMRRVFVSPNPARTELAARFTLPSDAPARLELLDLAGRRVRATDVSGAGAHVERFGGLGDLPAGLYLIRLVQGGAAHVARVALVR